MSMCGLNCGMHSTVVSIPVNCVRTSINRCNSDMKVKLIISDVACAYFMHAVHITERGGGLVSLVASAWGPMCGVH